MRKLLLVLCICSVPAFAEIQPETIGVVQRLPATYPAHWIIAQDASFFHMNDGKLIVLDADSDDPSARYKGMFNASFIGQFYQARTRPEMYVAETFHSRGTRGERIDVLTIYDKRTLAPIGEVVIPPKRASEMPLHYNLQLVDNESIALIYNFTPATSVSVVDLAAHDYVAEIPIPGCSLVYPMNGRSFASLCADGSILSVTLDENGKQASSVRSERFFDVNGDPLIEKAAIINGIGYFPTFQGDVYPIDFRGSTAVIGESWSLVDGEKNGWRPGGLQLTASDSKGRLYVLMHKDSYDGSHKDPGIEVWVFDTDARRRIDRIKLQHPAISIEVTRDDDPLLVTTNINMEVDVYNAGDGEHLRTIGNFGQETPLLLHGAR
ncbi:MAG: amine dehydrogenase [Gammaproteobacteria bacterium]|nr:MAG: amine dehydrogenase [Gammaproteobacteria bacterium]